MKDIPGYEGKYAVTEDGRVWSYPRKLNVRNGYQRQKRGTWLKPCNSHGYLVVALGARNLLMIHRLVALTYLPKSEGREHINHKNAVRSDNRVQNLEWCSPAENVDHARILGLTKYKNSVSIRDVPRVKEMRRYGYSCRTLAALFSVHLWTIQNITSGRRRVYA